MKLARHSLFSAPSRANRAAKSWRIADFQDNITVGKDGSAVVRERISLVFVGEWHGIHRTIPIEYPGPEWHEL